MSDTAAALSDGMMTKEYTAAVLWTSDDGRDCEDVRDFSLEDDARRWLSQQVVHETQTIELWHGRHQLEV